MKIYFNNAEIDLPINDNSYRYRAIKGEHSLTLYYLLPQHVEIPIGAYCIFEAERYTLEKPENLKMHNSRNFEYTLIMDSPQAKLSKYKFKDTGSHKLKFPLTAQPQEHLKMLVDNLNQRESGWTVGECITAAEKVIPYNHAWCIDALTQMADEFETEWEIVGKQISLRKVEYNKSNPLPLSYGRGNGFKSGVGRANEGGSPVEILFVQGGERNINPSTYGSPELLLPKNQTLEYEGRTYVSDPDGFSIRRADKPLSTQAEDSLDCSHIYPSRVGDVTSIVVVDAAKNFYDFIDNTIPADLNFADCLIDGETLIVIFQTGMLAGKEFEVKYIHADRRFEIVPQEIDGRTMPDNVFKPGATDKYAVFGISLPDAYVCNNAAKTGASWDMFREAAKYLFENEGQKFTFTGELDGIWAKKDWLNIGGRIKLGSYILFSDNRFQPDGVSIRIIGIKDFINNPHSPVIELSNSVVGSTINSDLRKIESNEVLAEGLHKDALQFTKRRFRDSIETMGMLEKALLKNFTGAITPITVRTMALLVGDESLQFRFVNNTTNPVTVAHNVVYNKGTKVLTSPTGTIQHMTLGIDAISSSHTVGEYKFWTLPKFDTPPLTDGAKKYYLYAKVSKTVTTGTFYISERAIEMEEVAGCYHLLMGILNSEYESERSYVSLYGFTEILPGQITVDLLRDAEASMVLDLKNRRMIAKDGAEIIGKITFSDGTSGYNNITDKPDLSSYDEAVSYIDNVLPQTIERLQAQIDGAIESWFYHYNPTLANIPASQWTTSAEREKHLDDTFTNLDTGESWRFTKNPGNVYQWTLMTDTAATKALVLAGLAKDTADGKRRTFYPTPYPPYDVGDLWLQGTSGDLMRCQTARASGSYLAADWVKAVKYTDDTSLNNFITQYQVTTNDIMSQIDGKVETWYQEADPSTAWNTAALRNKHVGDMWYNTTAKTLWRYTGSSWSKIEDKAAIDAATAATNAMNAAGGKATTYTSPPNPPYNKGDLWMDGDSLGGRLRQCAVTRTTGSRVDADWPNVKIYNNAQVTIEGGLNLQNGGITFNGNGGMSGTDTVRIWSGGSIGNPTFKVESSGNMETDGNVRLRGSVYSLGSFYIHNANGAVNGGFSSYGTGDQDVVRLWIGGSSMSSARISMEAGGDAFFQRIYIGGDWGRNRSTGSALTGTVLHVGSSEDRRAGANITVYGQGWGADVAPRLTLSSGENTVPLFEVSGKQMGDTYNRTVIRAAWMPNKALAKQYYSSSFGTQGILPVYYDVATRMFVADA